MIWVKQQKWVRAFLFFQIFNFFSIFLAFYYVKKISTTKLFSSLHLWYHCKINKASVLGGGGTRKKNKKRFEGEGEGWTPVKQSVIFQYYV